MSSTNVTDKQLKQLPAGGALVGKRNGQTIIHNNGSLGGYAAGKMHSNGGIKGVVKTDGKKIEFQGNEVVITAPAVADNSLHDFNGEKLTNRQILSRINESGGGVSFADGGEIPSMIKTTGKRYSYNGKKIKDTKIVSHCGCKHSMAAGGPIADNKKALKLINKLKPKKGKLAQYEIELAKEHTTEFMQMVADQALGYTRMPDGSRSTKPHAHGGARTESNEKYGKPLTDLAIQMFPLEKPEPKTDKKFKGLTAKEFAAFVDDYAYFFSADLDKVQYRTEKNPVTQQEYLLLLVDKLKTRAAQENPPHVKAEYENKLAKYKGILAKYNIIAETTEPKTDENKRVDLVSGVKVGDHIQAGGKYGNRITAITDTAVYFMAGSPGYQYRESIPKEQLELLNGDNKLVEDRLWNADNNHNYWGVKKNSFAEGGITGEKNVLLSKNGKPLKVYHGTPDSRFSEIKNSLAGQHTDTLTGGNKGVVWFTDNIRTAKSYADDSRAFDYQNAVPKVFECFLYINKPLVVNAYGQLWRKAEFNFNGTVVKGTRELVEYAKENGYDGIIINNVYDHHSHFNGEDKVQANLATNYAVFNDDQIVAAAESFEDGGHISPEFDYNLTKKLLTEKGYVIDNAFQEGTNHWFTVDSTRYEGRNPDIRKDVEEIAQIIGADDFGFDLMFGSDNKFYFDFPEEKFAAGGQIDTSNFNDYEEQILFRFHMHPDDYILVHKRLFHQLSNLVAEKLIYDTPDKVVTADPQLEIRLTDTGKEFVHHYKFKPDNKKLGGPVDEPTELKLNTPFSDIKEGDNVEVYGYDAGAGKNALIDSGKVTFKYGRHYLNLDDKKDKYTYSHTYYKVSPVASQPAFTYYKGAGYNYKNPFEVNKAIEELIDNIQPGQSISPEEKSFISLYSGYGGLEKFGATGKGLLYEYFTPDAIVRKMWALAYKYGFQGGKVLEPSCGNGIFIKYAPETSMVTGYEINQYSYKICQLLFPDAAINLASFETLFIKNNSSVKHKIDQLEKFKLIIGNPPYGEFGGIYAGMGEKSYTKADNYIDYFIFRGLDLLEKGGLLIMIIGTEVANGGTPWLQKPANKIKTEIMEKSDLIDAYRLPNGVFDRTDVLSDIIVLQKK